MKNKFYITTPVYYANAQPHIGHAYTTIAADTMVRFKKLQGRETYFLTGTDEHGAKIAQKAKTEGVEPLELVNEVVNDFKALWERLGIEYDVFTRTTDTEHKKAIQTAMQRLYDKGIIYKGEYEGSYCVGCEQFKNESDLVDGKCPDHNIKPEIMREESYLMKMTEMQNWLVEAIKKDEFKIRPEKYKKEILSFLEDNKLEDLSISRKNVKWGIPLPFDESHTVYVWFDAFLSYVTGLDWDGNYFINEVGQRFWPSDINLIGKDILRVHATIWPIMLKHLELEVSRGLFVHGHILSSGKKMSKTIGNVIGIDEVMDEFGPEATRYLLLSAGQFGDDVDLTMERMREKYNADLANGLGNLLSRVVTLAQNFQFSIFPPKADQPRAGNFQTISNDKIFNEKLDDEFSKLVENFELDKALEMIWGIVQNSNKLIEETKPWELVKQVKGQSHFAKASQDKKSKVESTKEFEKVMENLFKNLLKISGLLQIFMPETAEKIKKQLETGDKEILFKRK